MSLHTHFTQFAAYNAWANRQVYEAAARLSDEAYRRPVGAFFGSLHRTLNHILAADRIWMARFVGAGPAPDRLDAEQAATLSQLTAERQAEDDRIRRYIASLDDAALAGSITYSRSPCPIRSPSRYPRACPLLQPPDPSSRPVPHDPDRARPAEPRARPCLVPAHAGGAGCVAGLILQLSLGKYSRSKMEEGPDSALRGRKKKGNAGEGRGVWWSWSPAAALRPVRCARSAG